MFRLVILVLAVLVPSVVHAQWLVVPPGSQLYPVPPTGPGPVGAIVQVPLLTPLPTLTVPLATPPVYVIPAPTVTIITPPPPISIVPAPRGGGINPWIPLMGVPPAPGRSALEMLLLLQAAGR